MKKVYIDANIIIDLFDTQRESKYDGNKINLHKQAIKLFTRLEKNGVQVFMSEDIISNVAYYFRKNKNAMRNFVSFLNDVKKSSNYTFLTFGEKALQQTIEAFFKDENIDFEDTLQYFCALGNGCEIIYTNDKKFPNLDIKIKNTYDLQEET